MAIHTVLSIALVIRLILIAFAHVQDRFLNVKYTDIDYVVFSNASAYVFHGSSPYLEETYRYTPLVAWMLLPNVWWPDFGKVLFSLFDVFAGWLCYLIVFVTSADKVFRSVGVISDKQKPSHVFAALIQILQSQRHSVWAAIIWLFNPITAVVSSRGNAESVLASIVLGSLYALLTGHYLLAALLHGFAVHFKVYPVIYLPVVVLYLTSKKVDGFQISQGDFRRPLHACCRLVCCVLNTTVLRYVAVLILSTLSLSYLCYAFYGYDFVFNTYLYHVTRQDPKHNFSVYFYFFHLMMEVQFLAVLGPFIGLSAFLPQMFAVLIVAFKYFKDPPFAWFLTTAYFVTFNKVCTSQYFLWYLSLLPLIIPKINMSLRRGVCLVVMWHLSQAVWLLFAYLYEFKHWQTLELVWLASFAFLFTNLFILIEITRKYDYNTDTEMTKEKSM